MSLQSRLGIKDTEVSEKESQEGSLLAPVIARTTKLLR